MRHEMPNDAGHAGLIHARLPRDFSNRFWFLRLVQESPHAALERVRLEIIGL